MKLWAGLSFSAHKKFFKLRRPLVLHSSLNSALGYFKIHWRRRFNRPRRAELEITRHLFNHLRRNFSFGSCIGNQQSVVANHVDEPGNPFRIESNPLDRVSIKQLFALITHRLEPMIHVGNYLVASKRSEPAADPDPLLQLAQTG